MIDRGTGKRWRGWVIAGAVMLASAPVQAEEIYPPERMLYINVMLLISVET